MLTNATDDACFVLSTVAIHRELGGDVRASLFGEIFAIIAMAAGPTE
jgi:hypothetical protein